MRYLKLDSIEEGMVLGKTLHDSKGTVLLHKGTKLRAAYLKTIGGLQYTGLYIEDEFSEGVVAEDVISPELRAGAVAEVKNLFTMVQKDMTAVTAAMQRNINEIIHNIIDGILNTRGAVVNLMDLKDYDDYTYRHSVNVAVLSLIIGTELNLNRAKMFNLGIGALFHDIGKMFIDINILSKPSKLTPEEFGEIKKHPQLGFDFIRTKFNFSATAFMGIRQHHERFDGTGYPLGLREKEILEYGRIIAVSDVYDAVTSKRPYATPMLPSEAYEYIAGNSGSHFDPEIVNIFKRRVASFPIGVSVELSNGMRGIVVANNESFMNRPVVKIFDEYLQNDRRHIDLLNDKDALSITVTRML